MRGLTAPYAGRTGAGFLAKRTRFIASIISNVGRPSAPIIIRKPANREHAGCTALTSLASSTERPTSMNCSELFPSNYLKHADLQNRTHAVIIDGVTIEDLGDAKKPVVRFRGRDKALVMNITNYNAIADVYGDETGTWAGKPVELYPARVDFKGRMTDAIRVRVPQAAAPSAQDEECPF